MTDNPFRLPRTATPSRYEVALRPDLTNATFAGTVTIDLDVSEPTESLVANAAELVLTSAAVDGTPVTWTMDEPNERATFHLPKKFGPGTLRLSIAFNGILNDKLRGFYRSTFVDAEGVTQTIATTQMQATDCRRAFPCWDEPDFKAVFSITLTVPSELMAVSNSPELGRVRNADGTDTIRFGNTMKMSTYLVAFVVGPLEATPPVDVNGTPLRIIHVPGKSHLTAFALEIGAFSLRWFEDYYGIPYPGEKVDMIALPDFAAGAMENLGCITYRETALLVDPETATRAEEQAVADTVAHEIAHMWFGDLVTMRWWNGIWLNEAFATFMEVAACADFRPDWNRWTSFMLDRQPAFEVDSLANTRSVEFEVRSPEDADAMFDTLTYEKGGALLRMLEQYLGAERFREGVRHYLNTHAYGNTETRDLWDAIEATSGEPVRRIMDSWIWQRGFPLISAELRGDHVVLHQHRFRFDGEPDSTEWAVPLHVRQMADGLDETDVVLLDGPMLTIPLKGPESAVLVNAESHSFCRVAYSSEMLQRLNGARLAELSTAERCSLVDDSWAAVVAGRLAADSFCQFAQGFSGELNVSVWQMLLSALGTCDRIMHGPSRDRFRRFVRGLVGPPLVKIGWEPTPGESDLTGELRGHLIRNLAILGDATDARARARSLHAASLLPGSKVDPTVAAAALLVVASSGTDDDYEACLARYLAANNPQDKNRELGALSAFPNADQIARTLRFAMTDDVKTQNAPFVIGRCLAHRDHGPQAWEFVRENWTKANDRFPSMTVVRMLDPLKSVGDAAVHADVMAFFAAREFPQAPQRLQQILERQAVTVALHRRAGAQLARAFS